MKTLNGKATGLMVGATLMALALATAGAQKTRAAEVKKKVTGSVEVTVVLDKGGAPDGCTINVKDQSVTLAKGKAKSLFADVPVGEVAVTAEATVTSGWLWFKESARYIGVQPITVAEGQTGAVTVTMAKVADVNAYCLGCHPGSGQEVKPGQIKRDAHSSGQALGGKRKSYELMLAQTVKYNKKVEEARKQGQRFPLPMKLEERQVEEDGKQVRRLVYTCESCHTLHSTTPYAPYAIGPYKDKSDLCEGCHY